MFQDRARHISFFSAACVLFLGFAMLSPDRVVAKIVLPLQNQQAIKSVKVVIVDPKLNFRSRLTEAGMQKSGKSYETHDRSRISSLLIIMSESDIREAIDSSAATESGGKSSEFEPREGIYFITSDGKDHTFLFSKEYEGIETVQGSFDGKPIAAKHTFPRSLQSWVSEGS
ncbi:hypothetical protein C5O80_03440 [Burkholderia sp. SRS-46]|nr:hypothetical protein C5O80_03440 [Burkholderia sp. SRS-46]